MQKRINFFDGYTTEVTPSPSILLSGPSVEVVIPNNATTDTNITGLVFNSASFKGFLVDYIVTRKTDTALSEKTEIGQFQGLYNSQSGSWSFSQVSTGNYAGVDFSMNISGQFQFTSSNFAGTNYSGLLTYIISKTF